MTDRSHRSHRPLGLDDPEQPPATTRVLALPNELQPAVESIDHRPKLVAQLRDGRIVLPPDTV
jgi:hypothetical protein